MKRGYLMLEMMVCGAMAAVVLAGMMSFISSGRVQNIAAARDVTANQLVNEIMEQKRAGPYPPTKVFPTTIVSAGATYTREVNISSLDCPEVRANPGGGTALSLPCTNVDVKVEFSTRDGGTIKKHTSAASMRMYEVILVGIAPALLAAE